jgi:hypothetical protein
MLGAENSIAALLGTADRSTNIELVTCVNSGFCGASLVPGAADLLASEEQETVITTMNAAAVTANTLRRIAPTSTKSSRPKLVSWSLARYCRQVACGSSVSSIGADVIVDLGESDSAAKTRKSQLISARRDTVVQRSIGCS